MALNRHHDDNSVSILIQPLDKLNIVGEFDLLQGRWFFVRHRRKLSSQQAVVGEVQRVCAIHWSQWVTACSLCLLECGLHEPGRIHSHK